MGYKEMNFTYIEGQTPIDEDEASDLKLSHITTLNELNIWESINIQKALDWSLKIKNREVLDDHFLRELHKKMFEDTWKWAGKYRITNKNIGVDKHLIPIEVRTLLEDTKAWINYKTYPNIELAARFHHRLVSIHPFPNGNGRHSRLMTDIVISKKLELPPLTWGNESLISPGNQRKNYLTALRSADKGNIDLLINFLAS